MGDLKTNMKECADAMLVQRPLHALVHKDLEDIAVEIEYKCFTNNKVISLYRRSVVKQLTAIRECTKNILLFEDLKTHKPKSRASHGGDFKTIEADVKKRYGDDVLLSIQQDQQIKKDEELQIKREKLEKKMNANDPQQPKIDSIFKIGAPKVKQEPEDPDLADLKNLEDIQASIRQQLTAMDVDDGVEDKLEPPVITSEIPSYIKPIMVEQERVANGKRKIVEEKVNAKKKSRWGEFIPDTQNLVVPEVSSKIPDTTNGANFKDDQEKTQETQLKKLEVQTKKPETTTQPHLEGTQHKSQETNHRKPEVKAETRHKRPQEPKVGQSAEDKMNEKRKLSDLIIKNLNPFYSNKRFASKELFKKMARHLTKRFYKNYTVKVVTEHINKIFANKLLINVVEDYMTSTELKYYQEHHKEGVED